MARVRTPPGVRVLFDGPDVLLVEKRNEDAGARLVVTPWIGCRALIVRAPHVVAERVAELRSVADIMEQWAIREAARQRSVGKDWSGGYGPDHF